MRWEGNKITSSFPPEWEYETEVLVAGASFSGLTSALRATEQGAKVLVVEASKRIGGTALFSNGIVHTHNLLGWKEVSGSMPLIDPHLGKLFAETWPKASEWMQALRLPSRRTWMTGLEDSSGPTNQPHGGYSFSMGSEEGSPNFENKRAFMDSLGELIKAAGGRILTETRAFKLWKDSKGKIIGMRADNQGRPLDIKALALVLATGGFQANREMLKKYIGGYADLSVCRSSPYNTGAGIIMGIEAGAMLSRGMGETYGHTQPYPTILPQTEEEYEAADLTLINRLMRTVQHQDQEGVCVNMYGRRFFDEGVKDTNLLSQALTQQPQARGFLIFDSVHISPILQEGLLRDCLDLAKAHGAMILTANTIDELASLLRRDFGVPKDVLIDTIDRYNAAVPKGKEACLNLDIPRTSRLNPVTQPPFHAIPIMPGVSMTYGGLAINGSCQVMSTVMTPIPGLYAVPGTAGGIFYNGYLGALAGMLTFGYIAGRAAADYARATRTSQPADT